MAITFSMPNERAAFLAAEPGAVKAMRPFLGGYEFINGEGRWILHVADFSPTELRALPSVKGRNHAAVRQFRETTTGKLAKVLPASQPLIMSRSFRNRPIL